eukprot:NODE_1112_length_2158_cov_0.441962.p2 type:complete len:117 gc:universal NODE_1112_length_2158_cov_0.441962:492-142(-)
MKKAPRTLGLLNWQHQKYINAKILNDPQQSDLFSLGVVVSELFEISISKRLKDGRWIVKCIQVSKADRKIQYNSLRNIDANIAMRAMVKLLLQCDPERRPTPALLLRLIQFSEFYI